MTHVPAHRSSPIFDPLPFSQYSEDHRRNGPRSKASDIETGSENMPADVEDGLGK